VCPAAPPELPPIGPELTLRLHGVDAVLRLGAAGEARLDFSGAVRTTVEEQLRYGPPGVKLRVGAVALDADGEALGAVTLSLGDDDVAMLSRVELAGEPPLLRHVMAFELAITIERPPGGGPPLLLTSAQPPALVCAGLESFPPHDARYELQRPVELTPPGVLDEVAGELLTLTLSVTSSA
jgi:hypothetical protein